MCWQNLSCQETLNIDCLPPVLLLDRGGSCDSLNHKKYFKSIFSIPVFLHVWFGPPHLSHFWVFGGFLASGIVKLSGPQGMLVLSGKQSNFIVLPNLQPACCWELMKSLSVFNFSFRHRKPLGRQRGSYFHHAALAPGPQNSLTVNIQQPPGFLSSTLHSGHFSTWLVALCFCEAV